MSLPIVVDVAIGLIGFFFALSLLASTLLEFYTAALNRPGRILRWGIGHLFADPTRVGLAQDFYDHPLIKGMSGMRLPSRIEPLTAARVLIDLMDKSGVLLGAAPNPALAVFVDAVKGEPVEKMRTEMLQPIADWYKEGVERLSGVAARRSQVLLLGIGLFMAASMNIDTIAVIKALAIQDDLRRIGVEAAITYYNDNPQKAAEEAPGAEAVPAPVAVPPVTEQPPASEASPPPTEAGEPAGPAADDAAADQTFDKAKENLEKTKAAFLETYAGFPIFYKEGVTFCGALKKGWLGWLLTAVAISMGAQFWYRLLGELLKLRGGKSEPAPAKPAQ